MTEFLASLRPQRGDGVRKSAHPRECTRPLCGSYRSPRVQHVEGVRALENHRVRGKRQTYVNQALRLARVQLEQLPLRVDVGVVKVEPAHFQLGFALDLSIQDGVRVVNLFE